MLTKQENWRSVLNADPTDWLLEKDNPSVRYFALTNLLEMPEDSAEVRQAKAEIMETGVVPRTLSMQKDGGHWGKPQDFYERSKYKGSVWQLIILAELGADGNDKRIRNTGEKYEKISRKIVDVVHGRGLKQAGKAMFTHTSPSTNFFQMWI